MASSGGVLEIVDWIQSRTRENLIIGIDGYGGSGKSTLAARIGDHISLTEVVSYDDLYLPENLRPDFLASPLGIADAYDWQALQNGVLGPFRHGVTCEYPVLDWDTQERSTATVSANTRILIVEGVSCMRPELRELYDFRVWVHAPYEVRLARGITRDGEEMRGEWVERWMPAEEIYLNACNPESQVHLSVEGTT